MRTFRSLRFWLWFAPAYWFAPNWLYLLVGWLVGRDVGGW